MVAPLGPLTVITGPNGSGKSNLYRALRLLASTAQGGVIAALAREGGMPSTLWAGPEGKEVSKKEPVSLRLGFAADELSYAVDFGYPTLSDSLFCLDPEIKRECIWAGPLLRPAAMLADRRGPTVRIREHTQWQVLRQNLAPFDSMLAQVSDANRAPEVLSLREQIRSWRFYDHFRLDAAAPVRQPQLGTRTPVLADDGADLAAALQTIREIGDRAALDAAIDDAFPGSRITITGGASMPFEIQMQQPGLLRALKSAELSDGTLRSLLWVAALLTPRPPPLMVLNEPETSLHPVLLPALARLIIRAARDTQIWVVSHSSRLAAALGESRTCQSIVLEKELGETRIAGQQLLDQPAWHWPAR